MLLGMKRRIWQIQEAKNHFSEVVELAMHSGAQTVTKHGKPAVVIVSAEEYQKAFAPKKSLLQALRECPESLGEWLPPRSCDKARNVRFE